MFGHGICTLASAVVYMKVLAAECIVVLEVVHTPELGAVYMQVWVAACIKVSEEVYIKELAAVYTGG